MNTAFDLPAQPRPERWVRPARCLRPGLSALGLVLAAAATSATGSPTPETLQAATRALQDRAPEQARQLLGELQKQAPEDARVRFLQGVLQAQQGRTDEAIATFRQLTRSHPQLSEPHNNLGVLLAAKGQLREARAAFEQALLTHPSFAAAHRNLLDVQSEMARQSFARALMTDTGQTPARPALTLLAALDSHVLPPRAPRPSPVAAPSSPAPTASGPAQAQAPAGTGAQSTPIPRIPSSAPQTAAAPSRAAASTPPAATADKRDVGREDALRQSLQAWAKAWSTQAMRAYLGAYADDFDPPRGMNRAQWEADRALKITTKRRIEVEISQLEVQVHGNTATTRFRQTYTSDSLKVVSRKTLQWVWRDGRWRITRETTG